MNCLTYLKNFVGSFGSFLPDNNDQKVFAFIMKFPYICANLYRKYIFTVLCILVKLFPVVSQSE